MPVKDELFQDFSGGLNQLVAANKLAPNELPSASNVWADNMAIKARGAIVINTQPTAVGANITNLQSGVLISLSSTDNIFSMGTIVGASGAGSAFGPLRSVNGTTFSVVGHTTGTATTTSGSAVVAGIGTAWLTHLKAGDAFYVNSRTQLGEILTVDNDNQITLTANYSTNNVAAAYTVIPDFGGGFWPYFESMNSKVYMTTSQRTPGNWNGTTFSTSTSFPLVHFIKAFKNYMFGANTSANPARISWSSLKDPETWPASNFIDVNPDDGQPITGIFNDGISLLIFKKRSVYRLSGDIFDPANPTYTLTQVYTPPECVFDSVNSMAMFNGAYTMFAGSGLYTYNGSSFQRLPISDKLKTIFGSTFAPATFSSVEVYGYGQQAVTFNGNYWLMSFEATGSGTIVLDRNNNFWSFAGPSSEDFSWPIIQGMGSGSTAYNRLLCFYHNTSTGAFGTANLDQVYTLESVNATFTSKVFEFEHKQQFLLAWLHFKGAATGSITFGYKIDEGSTTNVTVDMTVGTGTRKKSPPILVGQNGLSIQFVVSHAAATEDFEVYGIEFTRRDLRN